MLYKIPIKIIELELNNFHILVESRFINNKNDFWVIDTGASKSVFDDNLSDFIERVGNESEDLHSASLGNDPIQTRIGLLKYFSLGKLEVKNMKVALFDMNHINKIYAQVTDLKICGLLGSDFLLKYNATIDYKKRMLKLRK